MFYPFLPTAINPIATMSRSRDICLRKNYARPLPSSTSLFTHVAIRLISTFSDLSDDGIFNSCSV